MDDAREALEQVPGLVERMVNLMNIEPEGLSMEDQIEAVLESMWW